MPSEYFYTVEFTIKLWTPLFCQDQLFKQTIAKDGRWRCYDWLRILHFRVLGTAARSKFIQLMKIQVLEQIMTLWIFFFQQTYGKIPALGQSHAHVMNLLPCDLSLRISNADGSYDTHFDISQKMNSIVYDLESGSYDLEVRAGPECSVTNKMMKLPFEAQSQVVSGFLVRSLDGNLNVMSIREAEEPKKNDDAAPKFK